MGAMIRRRRPPFPEVLRLADGGIAVQGGGTITPRQTRVLDHIAAGFTNAEIAAQLAVSRSTVARDIRHLQRATAATNRMALAAWWVEAAALLNAEQAAPS